MGLCDSRFYTKVCKIYFIPYTIKKFLNNFIDIF